MNLIATVVLTAALTLPILLRVNLNETITSYSDIGARICNWLDFIVYLF